MKRFTTDAYYPIDLDGLPASWEVAHVGDVIYDVQPGFASGRHNEEGIGVPHLRPMNVDRRGCVDLAVLKYVPVRDGPRVRRGDVLFNNTNSPELVGKTAHIDIDAECAFSNHMTRLRPPDGLVPKFVAYQLHYLWMAGYFLHRCVKHVNQASISSGTLTETVPFVVAPLTEQHRIVAEIEKHLTRLDAAVASLQRARANLRRYRASVLKAACEGRLVPTEAELARREGRDYEPASVLLERTLRERLARWEGQEKRRGKYWEPRPPGTSNLPPLPEGWAWTSLDQLLLSLRNGYSKRPEGNEGTAILRISAVRPLSVDTQDIRYVKDATEVARDNLVAPGDLLFTRYSGNPSFVGVCGVVRSLSQETLHPDKLIRVRLAVSDVFPWFVEIAANTGTSRDFVSRRVRTTAGQSGVSGADLRQTPIPLPPLAEQRRIVAEVERHLSVIQAAEEIAEANQKRAERLRQSILRRAFEGKLVPQDSSDEPASFLLERIRAERARLKAGGDQHTGHRTRRHPVARSAGPRL